MSLFRLVRLTSKACVGVKYLFAYLLDMVHKRAEQPHGKKPKHNSDYNTSVVRRSTIRSMKERAERLLYHGDNYESMDKLEPFIAFASLPIFSMDPERVLLVLHNCYLTRANKRADADSADIVKEITARLADKKARNASKNIMTRLEAASKTLAGEDEIDIVRADLKVGFSRKKPKAEKPMAIHSIEHEADGPDVSFEDRGPTAAELARIAKDHEDSE